MFGIDVLCNISCLAAADVIVEDAVTPLAMRVTENGDGKIVGWPLSPALWNACIIVGPFLGSIGGDQGALDAVAEANRGTGRKIRCQSFCMTYVLDSCDVPCISSNGILWKKLNERICI